VTGAGDDPRRAGIGRAAHVYLAHVRIQHHQLDPLGHVNNAPHLNFLEQAAIGHAAVVGYAVERLRAIGGLFIARRYEIDELGPALAGDRLRLLTWAVALRGARALRAYEIHRLPPGSVTAPLPADILLAPQDASAPSR
jgi:acyl-CoA thioesterase FadM